MNLILNTDIDPDEPKIYQAVCTVHDPRTDDGMEENAVEDRVGISRIRALQFAQAWSRQGYWGSVYNQKTGECVIDYSPRP